MKIIEPDVYTTGQIAKLCSVSIRTVARWIESNHVNAYRLPGDSTEYRVTKKELLNFLIKYGIPYEHIEDEKRLYVLLVNCSESIHKDITSALDKMPCDTRIDKTSQLIDTCIKIGLFRPDLLVLDSKNNEKDYLRVLHYISTESDFDITKIIVLLDSDDYKNKLSKIEAVTVLEKPVASSVIVKHIQKLFK